MKSTLVFLSALGSVLAQGVTEDISPDGPAPDGCMVSGSGTYWVTVAASSSSMKRDLEKRAGECTEGNLVTTLTDGVLMDSQGRTGYIASNYQFQFDAPPQAGAIYTAGFTLCGNSSLALGSSTTFYQCHSGDFANLYDRSWAAQCEPVELLMYPCSGGSSSGGSSGGAASQMPDGQVVSTQMVTTTMVQPISDGQPQVITSVVPVPICQISDGQVQAHMTPCASITYAPSPPPVSQISDGQIQAPTGVPVEQISDGQVQAPTGVPVSQIPDGQVQAPTGVPVSQISDGQVQVPTGAPVTQISDGQVQVPTGPPISQISDGQVQVPSGPPVNQISDGQVQVTSAPSAAPTSSPPVVTVNNAGRLQMGSLSALVIGILGAVAFL